MQLRRCYRKALGIIYTLREHLQTRSSLRTKSWALHRGLYTALSISGLAFLPR
jgi:hypothetical protein